MSCCSKNVQIVAVEYVQPLNYNEDIENMIHAIPVNDDNEIIVVPSLIITYHESRIPYKYKIVSTSVILCCFSIIIITIAVSSINSNKYQPIPNNSIGNSSYIKF